MYSSVIFGGGVTCKEPEGKVALPVQLGSVAKLVLAICFEQFEGFPVTDHVIVELWPLDIVFGEALKLTLRIEPLSMISIE
jgi:hypothetical protein